MELDVKHPEFAEKQQGEQGRVLLVVGKRVAAIVSL
jgi:hypothetical protein